MENLEMLVVNENGQMEINFEALEIITSEEFVKAVRYWVDDSNHFNVFNVKVFDDGDVYLHFFNDTNLHEFRYRKSLNEFDHVFVSGMAVDFARKFRKMVIS